MRKIAIFSMLTLDGIIQGPGSPTEDTSGGFIHGGWVAPFNDEVDSKAMEKMLKPADLLLGRKTFEIWENYWPQNADAWPGINEVTKYVFSSTRKGSEWENSVFLNTLEQIKELKGGQPANAEASDIHVWGSSELIQLLLKNDLVDELWLKTYPLTLGKGKRLFSDDGPIPATFTLVENTVTESGVIIANYRRAGEVKTGTVGQ